ncbi:MAG TPA: polysaccharide deacetylase family protein [Ktedonobacterales bacterium]
MWSRSVLRVVQGVAVAAVLLVSASACDSSPKRVTAASGTAAARAIGTTTQQPTPTTIPLQLGCGSNVHPASYVIDSGPAKRYVALTFDDGPSPDYTATMLTTLERTHTPATFFLVGSNVKRYPALVRREASDGFTLGIHTWDHPYMTKLSPENRQWELAATAQAIHNVLGANYCLPFWRPPFGDYDASVVAQARSLGLSTVTWDVDPRDWSSPGVKTIVDRVLSGVRPGAIILLHDGYSSRWQTAQALPLIIRGLKRLGYTPVTLPNLLAGRGP